MNDLVIKKSPQEVFAAFLWAALFFMAGGWLWFQQRDALRIAAIVLLVIAEFLLRKAKRLARYRLSFRDVTGIVRDGKERFFHLDDIKRIDFKGFQLYAYDAEDKLLFSVKVSAEGNLREYIQYTMIVSHLYRHNALRLDEEGINQFANFLFYTRWLGVEIPVSPPCPIVTEKIEEDVYQKAMQGDWVQLFVYSSFWISVMFALLCLVLDIGKLPYALAVVVGIRAAHKVRKWMIRNRRERDYLNYGQKLTANMIDVIPPKAKIDYPVFQFEDEQGTHVVQSLVPFVRDPEKEPYSVRLYTIWYIKGRLGVLYALEGEKYHTFPSLGQRLRSLLIHIFLVAAMIWLGMALAGKRMV